VFVAHSSNHDTQMADPGGGVRPTGWSKLT
jgi:hypothetical protein